MPILALLPMLCICEKPAWQMILNHLICQQAVGGGGGQVDVKFSGSSRGTTVMTSSWFRLGVYVWDSHQHREDMKCLTFHPFNKPCKVSLRSNKNLPPPTSHKSFFVTNTSCTKFAILVNKLKKKRNSEKYSFVELSLKS